MTNFHESRIVLDNILYLNNFKISFASRLLIFLNARLACTKTQSPFLIFSATGKTLTRRLNEPILTKAESSFKEIIFAGEDRHIPI
ncbi:MAG: hypothetical protein Q8L57_01845 [bacterium]|nr:hypothetical protein [bacterium]